MEIKELVIDENVEICRGCGEIECTCDAKTKIRLLLAEIFMEKSYRWLSKEILNCNNSIRFKELCEFGLHLYPKKQLYELLQNVEIYLQVKCTCCGTFCYGKYWHANEPLCQGCATLVLGE